MTRTERLNYALIVESMADNMSPASAFFPPPGNEVSPMTVSQAFSNVLKYANDKAGIGKRTTVSFEEYTDLVGIPMEVAAERPADAQAFYNAVNLRLSEFAKRHGIRFINYGGTSSIEVIFSE